MGLKFPSLKEQNGDATIFLAMILALGVGTAVYYNMDKLNQQLKVNKVMTQKERAETRNLSGLAQAAALMQYSVANPDAEDANVLPYIYPDPYLPAGKNVTGTRAAATTDTWSFTGAKLTVNSPSEANLKTDEFSKYIFQDQNRPGLTNKSSIQFLGPVKSTNADMKNYITGYEVAVTSTSFDGQNLTSRATIPVAPPAVPKCALTSLEGNKYQPNAPMTLVLSISGVADSVMIPETTDALTNLQNDTTGFAEHKDFGNLANSIRRIKSQVHTWKVMAPRPLVAVDGDKDVPFEAFVYLKPVNNSWSNSVSCSFKYTVTPPATCKLWTDKATVSPGQCVNITSATSGPVQANSLVMSAKDASEKPVAGLTQTGATGKFCTPSVSSYSTGVEVPKESFNTFDASLSALTNEQQKAIYNVLSDVQTNLKKMFKQQPELQNLSMGQYNELWDVSPTQQAALDTLDLSTFSYLNSLTPVQEPVFRALKPADFNDLNKLSRVNLPGINSLKTLSATTINDLMRFDSAQLMSYLGSGLDAAAASSATPVDYIVGGVVKGSDGQSTSSCIVHVTAGTNKCDLYGSQFPNKGRNQTVVVNYLGNMSQFNFTFYPSKPNWEVAGTAVSPTKVEPCPKDARCYAVEHGNNRTPFVVVANADAASCNATANQRIDLGCFAADTRIRMGDGSDKAIAELREGDKVYNPLRKTAVAIKRVTPGPERIPLWTVQTAEGSVRVTSKHPFLTSTGLKQTLELKAGDRILGSAGEQIIQSIAEEKDAPKDWVWNFVLDVSSDEPADHAILADGVVTGDLHLQEQLAREKNKALTQAKP